MTLIISRDGASSTYPSKACSFKNLCLPNISKSFLDFHLWIPMCNSLRTSKIQWSGRRCKRLGTHQLQNNKYGLTDAFKEGWYSLERTNFQKVQWYLFWIFTILQFIIINCGLEEFVKTGTGCREVNYFLIFKGACKYSALFTSLLHKNLKVEWDQLLKEV